MLPTAAQWCSCMLIINFFHKAFLFTLTMTCNKYIKYVSVNNGSIYLFLPDSLVSGFSSWLPCGLDVLPHWMTTHFTNHCSIRSNSFFQIVYVLCLSLLYYEFINVISYMSYMRAGHNWRVYLCPDDDSVTPELRPSSEFTMT